MMTERERIKKIAGDELDRQGWLDGRVLMVDSSRPGLTDVYLDDEVIGDDKKFQCFSTAIRVGEPERAVRSYIRAMLTRPPRRLGLYDDYLPKVVEPAGTA